MVVFQPLEFLIRILPTIGNICGIRVIRSHQSSNYWNRCFLEQEKKNKRGGSGKRQNQDFHEGFFFWQRSCASCFLSIFPCGVRGS